MAYDYMLAASMPATPYQSVNAGVIPPDVYGVAINWFVNRTPLATRLPSAPCGAQSFKLTKESYRPRSFTCTVGDNGSTAALTISDVSGGADASIFIPGDLLEVESELMMVTAASAAGSNTVAVTRAYGGSSGASHSGVTGYLLTNARTGSEIDQTALERIPVVTEQYLQTIQQPYQVGGALQSNQNYVSAYGDPLTRQKWFAVEHCMEDLEGALVYGRGVALAADTTRPSMLGFRSLCVTNNVTSPTNAGAYTPTDLIRDTLQACRQRGGAPDVFFVSSDFMVGLAKWGFPAQRLMAGDNLFGVAIDLFAVSFLPTISIIEAPLLRTGTVLCMTSPEVRIRVKRPLFDQPRGYRGDAFEGDMIMEAALELENEQHHSYVTGITGFAAA